jgi:hypothetical protein
MEFEDQGYSKEYFVNGKLIGSVKSEKDRDVFGYMGRKTEVLTETITFHGKKKIKIGTEVTTELSPICGKLIKSSLPESHALYKS